MIIIEIIISDDNNDNHNTGQVFRTYISIEPTYQVISKTKQYPYKNNFMLYINPLR